MRLLAIRLAVCVIILFITSCNNSDTNKPVFKVKYYDDGIKKSEGYYKNDTVLIDTFKMYSSNGKIAYVEVYNGDGKLDGQCYYYSSKGNLEQTKTFSKGELTGFIIDYYDNGLVKTKSWVNNGIFQGDVIHYSLNGKPKLYNFYDFKQRNIVFKEYDTISGNVILKQGKEILVDTLEEKGDTLFFTFLLSHPPYTKNILSLEELNDSKKALKKHIIIDSVPFVKFNVVKYPEMASIKVTASQYDSILKETINFVFIFNGRK